MRWRPKGLRYIWPPSRAKPLLGPPLPQEPREGLLVQDGDAVLLGLLELGAGALARHQVVGLPGDAGPGSAAQGLDEVLRLVAGPAAEGAGDDEGEAGQGPLAGGPRL